MNGKKAKALRREIYGEESLKQKRRYTYDNGARRNVSTSSRARYQQAKKG